MNARSLNHQLEQLNEDSAYSYLSQSERFIFEHQTCAMCESELEISHEINKPALRVKEEAHCPCCGIRVRSTHHLMQ